MKVFGAVLILVLFYWQVHAQSFTSSNLPVVLITTDGNAQIPDEPKVFGSMKIIYSGEGVRNFISDQHTPSKLNYNGRIAIEVRGSSSQFLEKKQYSFTTYFADNITKSNVSLLGMPIENDWILNGIAFDSTLIRDYISYVLAGKMGEYAPRVKYCEVVLNGAYVGLYFLQEKIKEDDSRVDIVKMDLDDQTLPDLSGGYITKADRSSAEDPTAWTMSSYLGDNDIGFVHVFPKSSSITSTQSNYIKSQFDKLSATAQARNASVKTGYPSVIDVPSFVDFMLLNELAANVDAYQLSTYFHKDKNGKLRAGPVWDLNLTFGNDLFLWGYDRSKTNQWQFNNGDNEGPKFWKDLFNSSIYRCYLSKRWNELTQVGKPLHVSSINQLIDETVLYLSEAIQREDARWQSVGNHAFYIRGVKRFLEARTKWMTDNLGSFGSCNALPTPPLVISKIMYHPSTSGNFTDSNDQEFIEILNNGEIDVNVSGLYFRGLGFAFQFPADYIFPAQEKIQLANDLETFKKRYGYEPFGEFTRNLSNESQNLVLADGFGNVIDEVGYSNTPPWPNVNANGFYLELENPDVNNNEGANWVASNSPLSTIVSITELAESTFKVYPNPVDDQFTIESAEAITEVNLHDSMGRLVQKFSSEKTTITIECKTLPEGVYILTCVTQDQMHIRKVIKR
jgi:hypothetical protein